MFDDRTQLEALWAAPLGFAILDAQLRYVRANDALAAIDGVPAAEHAGKTVHEVPPAPGGCIAELLVRVRDRGIDETVDVGGRRVSCFPVREDGRVTGVGVAVVDAPARAPADATLHAQFKRIFETNLLGILFWDLAGAVHEANDEFLRIVGYDRADLARGAIDWAHMTPDDHKAQDEIALDELRRTGKHAPIEKEYVKKDGSRTWVLVGSAMTEGDRGVGFVLDISRQKRMEAALRESEQRAKTEAARAEAERSVLDAILGAAPAGIILADAGGRLLRVNPANEQLWGPSPLSTSVEEYREWKGWWADRSERHGRRVEPEEWAMSRALRGETVRDDIVEIEPFGAPGVRRIMVNSGAPVRDSEGHVVGAVVAQMDISALVSAEAAARKNEELLHTTMDDLRALNDRLEEADRRKDEFIAILAHELRNPLAPVRSAVELLRRVGPSETRLDRARDVIDRQVSHMARLIDDLLDVSRIARGKLALHRERCDLAAIARQTAEDYRPSLEASGLTLDIHEAEQPLFVDGDPVRLAQMIGNLLNNAGRFTEPGGLVRVRTEIAETERQALVHVEDHGVGIEPALLSRLFDPFSQADQGLARTKGGLGLGLALTKGLAELHGGAVSAYSEGRGRGSTFTLRIPLSETQHAAASGSEVAHGRALKILVVEDNEDAAEILGELLQLTGHDVRLAQDGEQGVSTARDFRPDVIISDLGLPGSLDGYGVARTVRSEPSLEGTYLVALSGYANEEARRRARRAGFDAHLAKPADLAGLERTLADVRRR